MFRLLTVGLSSLFLLSACASGTFKARQEQRDKLASAAGLYCEFINGDKHPDVDVELNMQMAKRCDSTSHFSIASYRNSSDQNGMMYCCSNPASEPKMSFKKDKSPAVSGASKSDAELGLDSGSKTKDK